MVRVELAHACIGHQDFIRPAHWDSGELSMSYVPGFEYDLFISYAAVDNEPMPSADSGWVDTLVQILTSGSGLAGKLGRRESFSWWLDKQNLRGNHEADSHIPAEVRRSAILVVVLSPGYVASTFCRLELQTFLDAIQGAPNRVFVIYREQVVEKRHKVPDALKALRKYEFWELDKNRKPRILGWPLPNHRNASDRAYFQRIDDVCKEIADQLDELKAAGARQDENAAVPALAAALTAAPTPKRQKRGDRASTLIAVAPRPAVLLAETTDDLIRKREDAQRYLEQAGIDVVPSGSYYGLSAANYEKALSADLAKCAAFVQILGPELGRRVDGIADGFGWLQYNVAKQSPLPILQWRGLELADLRAVEDPMQRRLLETAEAMPFEDFKRKILENLRSGKAKSKRPSFFFINCDSVDVSQADAIGGHLAGGVDWERPLYEEKPKARVLQESIEASLVDCDGLLIVHGKSPVAWVRAQLQLYRKLRQRRAKDPQVLAVVQSGHSAEFTGLGLAGLKIVGIDDLRTVIGSAMRS